MKEDTTSRATREVVERMLGGITAGDMETLLGCIADDVHFYMPGETEIHGHYEGKDGWAQAAGAVLERLSDPVQLNVESTLIAGEWAVVQATGSSTTLSGAPYRQHYCFIWQVKDGKIVDMTEYHDTDIVRRVLLADD
jgi:ketosteroid isomerase-like protein